MPQSKSTKKTIKGLEVKNPSYRYMEVLEFINAPKYTKRKALPKDYTQYQIALVLAHREESEPAIAISCVRKAILMDTIPSCRAMLRGLLMSGESLNIVASIIGETLDLVECYSELFFDISVFLNDLIRVAYIRNMPSESEDEKFEKQLLSWGHYLGSQYIAWKIGAGNKANMLPSEAVRKVLDNSVWRSAEHALADIESGRSKESRAWVPQVLKSAELLNTLETTAGMENALAGLKIKLSGKDDTLSKEDLEMEIKG